MKEYRVQWTKCPTNYNETHVLFVTADTEGDAKTIAKDHIERKFGISTDWMAFKITESIKVPLGSVMETQ